MKKIVVIILFLFTKNFAFADEGLWLPMFLKQLNEADMKAKGMKINAEDIYSVNKSSLKDAIVLFGGGCTGELISEKGLLITNHHCGFSQIQLHSSLENDYLKNGFWSYSLNEELPCPGLSVTFIIRIDDVTETISSKLNENMSPEIREAKIKELSADIEKSAISGTHYNASVKSFYNGNQFYLIVMEIFKDVRLVGAPPSSIGKFGGDTDNWMWPRHTGDFSLFRVYADKNNNPAPYNAENIPFKPRSFLPISLKGYQPGDFTLVYGFPGRTTEYIPSFAINNIIEFADPVKIKIRTARLNIIDAAMRSGDKLRIQYAAKQSTIANGWKKWQGELLGLQKLNTLSLKREEEQQFSKWVAENNKSDYANLMTEYDKTYKEYNPISRSADYINEAAYGVEMLKYAKAFGKLGELSSVNPEETAAIRLEAERILNGLDGFYKNFDPTTDKKLFTSMMQLYYTNTEATLHPVFLEKLYASQNGNFEKMADEFYGKSLFSDAAKMKILLTNFNGKKIKQLLSDPAYILADEFGKIYSTSLEESLLRLNASISVLNRKYMAAQMEWQKNKLFYPDANLTLRVSYGQVSGYDPRDAVKYQYQTTLKGIIEKEDSSVEEFVVPAKLKELYTKKDYGAYSSKGDLPVAFIASNHTTGGNSGSPVINANGELIGTNFDRVWEGTMSDIAFDPTQCRNIALDIRYTLFIIDKFAGCKRLIDEMKIVK